MLIHLLSTKTEILQNQTPSQIAMSNPQTPNDMSIATQIGHVLEIVTR